MASRDFVRRLTSMGQVPVRHHQISGVHGFALRVLGQAHGFCLRFIDQTTIDFLLFAVAAIRYQHQQCIEPPTSRDDFIFSGRLVFL